MSSTRIVYSQRPDARAEAELSAVANVFRFVLDSHAKKEAAPESRPDDAERIPSDSAKTSIPK